MIEEATMLLGFRVANVLSFREEQSISFVATELNDGSARPTGIRDRGKEVSGLPVLGIYGANASGKTNVLAALRLMRGAVLESVGWFSEPNRVRRVAFALDPRLREEPSFSEIDIVLSDGVRYTYGFEIDDDRVRGEWLHAYPKGRKQVWFNRKDDEIDFPGEGLRGEKLELARRTRPDALFLSVAAQFNHEQLLPVFGWFRDNLWVISPEGDKGQRENFARVRVVGDATFRERMTRLLQVADLGVTGFDEVALGHGEIRLLHRTGTREVPLDYGDESLGTRSWFGLLGALLAAFDAGATVLVDELDASLHPTMSAEVIHLFSDPEANPHGAQMLFTTHEVTLLHTLLGDDRVLDRDTVWLAEKDADGATELYPLTSVSPPPRKEDNLFRRYLLGRYGGVPRVSSGVVAREVEEMFG
ncbi:MAG: ATP-binding protein [Actinomycetota bacterium]|nr:ATP-binding protein [Actinomycetota bacterium]